MLYNILKFLHVVSMAAWFGGLVTMFLVTRLLARGGDQAAMRGFGRLGGLVAARLFLPAVIATLITGIGMVHVGGLSFRLTWIIWGIVGLVASMYVGGGLTGRTGRRLGEAIARGEIDAAGIAATQKRLLIYALINMLILLSVIWAMVAKPS